MLTLKQLQLDRFSEWEKESSSDPIGKLHYSKADIRNFNPEGVPSITLFDYITRLMNMGQFSEEFVIHSLILMERFLKYSTAATSNEICFFKLFSTALYISQKMLNEINPWHTNEFSQITGIRKQEMHKLERAFMLVAKYELHVTMKQIRDTRTAMKESKKKLPNWALRSVDPKKNG